MCREYWRVLLMGAWGILCKLNFFFPLFFGWLNIVEGKSINTLGVQSLFPDPSGTELHQSELRTEAAPCLFTALTQSLTVTSVQRLRMRRPLEAFFYENIK